MNEYINKKVNFVSSKLTIKINKILYSNDFYKLFLCFDANNASTAYIMKIAVVRSEDKATCNLINTEIVTLVI